MITPSTHPSLALVANTLQDDTAAAELGRRLNLPVVAAIDLASCDWLDAVLLVSADRLFLQQTGKGAPGPVCVDFGSAAMRYRRRAGQNELLGRAVGLGKKAVLRVLDATAGLGRDSFVLADLGCEVILCEREPVVAEMLRWGMRSAASHGDQWLDTVLDRMHLLAADARHQSVDLLAGLDVIYLDPMFPQRSKSAAVKKEMALLQQLLDCRDEQEDADALLLWALSVDVARVVVKRPPRAPHLAGRDPSHCISGKAVRYDVYVKRKLG